ncbi:hypothetical protein ACFSSC_01935 [Corynebacterium mendelii]|uniref:Uncharacterized protein n=1 Tax=Corynebacterium mendelii TaxID=2765362 RepID=A0A939E232_9CORY|nr:hypothetical protein [Corynebacterium mendelii]MBN9644042.1 hypothetical protein [Corynebacterium mendelii]
MVSSSEFDSFLADFESRLTKRMRDFDQLVEKEVAKVSRAIEEESRRRTASKPARDTGPARPAPDTRHQMGPLLGSGARPGDGGARGQAAAQPAPGRRPRRGPIGSIYG